MELKPLKLYKVTIGNSDGSIIAGDHLWQSKNGILNITGKYGGFMMPDELTSEIMDFEAEIDKEYVICATPNSEFPMKKTEVYKMLA